MSSAEDYLEVRRRLKQTRDRAKSIASIVSSVDKILSSDDSSSVLGHLSLQSDQFQSGRWPTMDDIQSAVQEWDDSQKAAVALWDSLNDDQKVGLASPYNF